jgi:hypothetical protein
MSSETALTTLAHGYMNLSAYAKIIKPEVQRQAMKPVSEASIVVALSRLHKSVKMTGSVMPHVILDNISVKSDLIEFAFEKTKATEERLKRLYLDESLSSADFFTVTHGIGEISIVVPKYLKKTVLAAYRNHTPKLILENIASITIRFSEKYLNTPNVFYSLLHHFAMRRINIVEIISTFTETTFILSHKDLNDGFAIINTLARRHKP